MTRRYERSLMGTRLIEKTPPTRQRTTIFLVAMRSEGFIAPLTVDGAINGPVFLAWVQQHLAPALKPGDIVVMDNLSSHKVAAVRQVIEAVGAKLRYLPPCSPGFNPIELAFSSSRNYFATARIGRSTNSGSSADASWTDSNRRSAGTIFSTAATDTLTM